MDTLMSLPMTASVLTEYGDLEEACRSCGCDGLEVVWGTDHCPGFGSAARYIATT